MGELALTQEQVVEVYRDGMREALGVAVARLTRWLADEAGESFDGAPDHWLEDGRRKYTERAHRILECRADEYDVSDEAP